ncbi:MAG: Smr/MutS family protein [Holdemania massiliensis]
MFDGLEIVDKYLDDAVVARIGSVRIIHGAGTGVLRKAVQDKLNRIGAWKAGGSAARVRRRRRSGGYVKNGKSK